MGDPSPKKIISMEYTTTQMGNQQSASTVQNINTNYDTFVKYIDTIAAEYITGSTFSSLKDLANPNTCDRLVIITADLFNKRLSAREVQHLYRRRTGVLEQGDYKDDFTKNKLVYFRKDDTDKLNVQDARLKRNMCIGISRFYVQVAHLFAAIMNTVKVWNADKDKGGTLSFCDTQTYGLFTKRTDPSGLANSANDLFNLPPNADAVTIDPGVCSTLKSGTRLSEIPAFKTLDQLYANIFEYTGSNAGKFVGMTDEMRKKVYINDVRAFYGMLHGKNASEVPPNVVSFQDIPLPDITSCRENRLKSGRLDLKGNNGENYKLYSEYANHIMKMMLQSKNDRAALISLLNEVFVVEPMTDAELEKEQNDRLRRVSSYLFSGDDSSSRRENKYKIYIHPELTETKLQNIVNAARVMIVKIYTNCQSNFLNGLKLLEAISAQLQSQDLRGRRDTAYNNEHIERSGNNNYNDTNNYNNNNNERRRNVQFEEPQQPQQPQRNRESQQEQQPQQQLTLEQKHQKNKEFYKNYEIKKYKELIDTLSEMKRDIDNKNPDNKNELNSIIDKKMKEIINKGDELINDKRSVNTINATFDALNREVLTTKEIIRTMMAR